MKVLVQSLISKEYLTNTGAWASDPAQARDFITSTDAQTFCEIHALSNSSPAIEMPGNRFEPLPLIAQNHRHNDQPLGDF